MEHSCVDAGAGTSAPLTRSTTLVECFWFADHPEMTCDSFRNEPTVSLLNGIDPPIPGDPLFEGDLVSLSARR
jgi:hypothetical protein